MQNNEEPGHSRYRLNKKKFISFLLVLGFTAVFIAVAAFSLANADKTVIGAGTSATAESTIEGRIIVVDAGHGGFDPGAIGKDGTHEADLNLAVAKCLKSELEDRGAKVVMTRDSDVGLGKTQIESLQERQIIIENSGADLAISIHMNSMDDDTSKSGPLVLFLPGSEQGKTLAEAIQKSLNEALGASGTSRSQDLMVLKGGSQPSVLVECGYISNPNEEKKLKQADYQQKLAKAICDGAEDFFSGE